MRAADRDEPDGSALLKMCNKVYLVNQRSAVLTSNRHVQDETGIRGLVIIAGKASEGPFGGNYDLIVKLERALATARGLWGDILAVDGDPVGIADAVRLLDVKA